jgi:hypothetical protein
LSFQWCLSSCTLFCAWVFMGGLRGGRSWMWCEVGLAAYFQELFN